MSSDSAASDRQDLWWAFYGVLAAGLMTMSMPLATASDESGLEWLGAVGIAGVLVGMLVTLMTMFKLGEKLSGFAFPSGVITFVLVPYVATVDDPNLLWLVRYGSALFVGSAVNFCVLAWQARRKKNGTRI
ncbi:hypothetical protein K3X41_02795 [Aliiroseovarius crassostreae]|uniref:hypothetical protein n=1 Tax=Aliiroseovarius crassostreae TaxID=154981 RepID=UPI0022038E19|nr:hypothetical protein [Aliiroseovarius crassostreae]UWQ11641.1 hypothetical protein K3X41_02795 [Aliiroseovarius crassostreae]